MTRFFSEPAEGWIRLRLKECLQSLSSGARPTGGAEAGRGEVFTLGGEHINDKGGFDWSSPQYVPHKFFESIREDAEVAIGDILINKDGAKTGKIALVREDFPHSPCCVNEHVFRLRSDSNVSDETFLFYSLLSYEGQSQIARSIQGSAQGGINQSFVKQVFVQLPKTLLEQRKIAKIVCAVDTAISGIETKLTAARRMKTALMQQLFTRGIPGRHTRFKQTKIGEIPEEWDVTKISEIVSRRIFNGFSPQSRPDPPGTPIINVSCISSGLCDPGKVTYVDLDSTPSDDYMAKQGDFFILRGNGNRDYIGTGGMLKEPPPEGCVFSDLLFKVPFDTDKIVEGFMPLLWQSSSFLRRLQSKAVTGSGLWKIGLREINRHVFAKPTHPEQQEIVDLLHSADENISSCETEVHALERLKRSLLQNLLTGKVRVKPLDKLP